ncbi:hypothetical protein L6270_04020 [Candidatus Parcubacteria bacterium]|nr:hypothetical protein [Patescibacteria group bacterium]MBU4309130.1 hypothetical protein [Patescibacteria group bacterium]MBU4432183.1 hypothetical protein [Patescibacteria group bacterium]MBU4577491.1 hypothetical protein [Patescibacteria group bacterium]MCG2697178.1 hypothetical protein [Candidatus Parcubacteria bacterium]
MSKKILFGLTTTPGSDWREKIRKIDDLGIKELALFPTFLKPEERKELYQLLEGTNLENIPHVHLRDDMEQWELDYFVERYKTQVFNIHSHKAVADYYKNSKYVDMIYIENHYHIDDDFRNALNLFAGVCPDFSHWEDYGVIQESRSYDQFPEILKSRKIGCCHISAIRDYPDILTNYLNGEEVRVFGWHKFEKLNEFDYLKKYFKYLPDLISIELENSFKEQILARDYIINLIKQYE